MINAGTANVTQGSPIVVLDAAAQFALVGLTTNEIVQRTFRAGAGNLYNIIAYAAPDLTVAYGYNGPTAANVVYSIYQLYYLAPADFLSWTSVINPFAPTPSFKLTVTKEELDARDPQRGWMGQPNVLAQYRYENPLPGSNPPILDRYRYEMWPAPVVFQQYPAMYQKKGLDLVNGQRQPVAIPDALVMARARFYAYVWALANKGKHVELKGTDWMQLRVSADKEYQEQLAKAQRQDEETFDQNMLRSYMETTVRRWGYGGPNDLGHAPIWGGGWNG